MNPTANCWKLQLHQFQLYYITTKGSTDTTKEAQAGKLHLLRFPLSVKAFRDALARIKKFQSSAGDLSFRHHGNKKMKTNNSGDEDTGSDRFVQQAGNILLPVSVGGTQHHHTIL